MFDDLGEEVDRTLIIYIKDSHYKYYGLYKDYLFSTEENGDIVIYKRDRATGDESLDSRFRTWDYFIIE